MSFLDSLKQLGGHMKQAVLPTVKRGLKNAFLEMDPQWEYDYRLRSFADAERSRYCVEGSLRVQGSVNLPGSSDVMLANSGGALDLGGGRKSTDPPAPSPKP